MIDYTGTDPYELFDSEDDAAIDFANCYNAISIENQKEYGATIYKCIIKEIKIFKITITTRFCNSEIKFTHFFTMPVYVTKYYYTTPLAGFKDFVIPNLFGIGQLVAIVHTHGNYIDSYGSGNDNFSTGLLSDIGWANLFRVNMYVATPSGYLKKYTYANRNDDNSGITTICTDIPWDPNSPFR